MGNGTQTCQWGAVAVEMGDLRRDVESIDDVQALFRKFKLPMDAALLNYRSFHQSTLDPGECIARVAARSLEAAGLRGDRVGMLVLASADVGFLSAGEAFVPALLERIGLTHSVPLVVAGQECVGLLTALDLAWRHVRDGHAANVLVVSYDRARSEARRVQTFGVVGDAAVACVVSAERPLGWAVRRFVCRAEVSGMRGNDDFASRKALIGKVMAEVLGDGVSLSDVGKVFTTNFFKPIATFNASCAGIAAQQLYMEHTAELGHCLGADPLLNLAMYVREHPHGLQGGLHLLQAFAPGWLAAVLIEQVETAVVQPAAVHASAMVVQTW
jgi:hypothetical protein